MRNSRTKHTSSTRLREELDQAKTRGIGAYDIPSFVELSKLSYLNAVISETLRLSPSIGAAFGRRTSVNGAEVVPDVELPGGVEVGVNNWIIVGDTEFYELDAEVFLPERWFENEKRKRQ